MILPGDLLERPAGESVRLVVLSLLEQGHEAAQRLQVPTDVEALHDFRVAIRRTRAAMGNWSDRLPRKTRKLRRELTRIQRATGIARDSEVAILWLEGLREGSTGDSLEALQALLDVFETEKATSLDVPSLAAEFEAARESTHARMRMMEYDLLADGPEPTFAHVLSLRLRDLFEELAALLSGVSGPNDVERMHDARIAGKNLRYLIEPIAEREPIAAEVLSRMKSLQDLLGELHDAHVLSDRINAIRLDIDSFNLRSAVDSILARNVFRAVALHGRLDEEWIRRDLSVLRGDIDRLAQALSARKGVEIERKYLLSGMPELPPGEMLEIEQGYVPGERVHERVRRTRRGDAVTYYRTIKMGRGVQRIELEEETTREIFEALWALTIGKRVRKRRYVIADGELTWEIDQFLDRELVLAEVELPSADTTPAIPSWLAVRMIEDVTDRGEFTNLALAR